MGRGFARDHTAHLREDFHAFTNVTSGKLIDDPGSSAAAGTQLVQWQSNGGLNQQWNVATADNGSFKITNRASGLVMDVSGGSTSDGAAVIQWTDNGGANQHWTFQLVN